jgi:hypothetical protein
VPWPTPQDYQEAVQNPRLAFRDPDLQAARPKEDAIGLPQPIAGNFASVYKMLSGSARTWAVRCFLREFGDQRQRYDAISWELKRLRLPYTVGFEYQPDGIRVRGGWFPVLKMEWVQGETLTRYVASRLGQPALRDLAEKVVVMTRRLADAGIAHGDLQHGNILVVGGEPRLIDYDGMFVPALAGWRSHEVGHPNFQHPRRTDADFGPGADNFSNWVIYLSLLALSADPGLWSRHQGGDECLLFRRADFELPERSRLLGDLERSADPLVAALAATFRSFLWLDPLQIPLLDRQAVRPAAQQAAPGDWLRDYIRTAATLPGPATPDWLRDQANPTRGPVPAAGGQGAAGPIVDISWLMDSWGQPGQAVAGLRFGNSPWPDRITWAVALIEMLVVVLMILIGLPGWAGGIMTTAAITAAVGFSRSRYANDPGVQTLRRLVSQITDAAREAADADDEVRRREADLKKLLDDLSARELRLQAKIAEARTKERDVLATIAQTLAAEKARLRQERDQAQRDLDAGLRRVRDRVARAVADLDRRTAGLPAAEDAERDMVLSKKQAEHVQAVLRAARVANADIPNVGPKLTGLMIQGGFVTAADITGAVTRVHGIGSKREQAVLAWRARVEVRAERTKPAAITPIEERAIRDRFEGLRTALLAQRVKEQSVLPAEERLMQAAHTQTVIRLNQEETAKHRDAEARENQARTQAQLVIEEAEHKLDRLRQERQSAGMNQARQRCAEARQAQASANWRKARLEHQVALGRTRLTVHGYVKRVLGVA